MADTKSEGTLTQMLRSIHERVRDVSEEQILEALSETETVSANTPLTKTMSVTIMEKLERHESVSTQTA